MRPRIFILMLTAFALVIILGVGGMVAFFGLTVASIEKRSSSWGMLSQSSVRAEARDLASYYQRRGSWDGVDAQLSELKHDLDLPDGQAVTLVDAGGVVLASTEAGQTINASGYSQRVPISNDGEMVGTLVISYSDSRSGMPGMMIEGKQVLKGFASAGLALAAILLALATFFSRQISHPMGQLTHAAQALADGEMSVRVRPSRLREVGDLAEAFNRMADSLVQADQQRRQLTADVAHELRTPLSIIKGRLEGIQDGVYRPDEPQIAGLLGEVALLERLIEDLRLLAMAEAGQLALYPEAVSPARLARDAGAAFAIQAAERGVSLRVAADDGLPEITIDPQRITQVLGNLLGNALRHTPAGGSVTLRVTRDEGRRMRDEDRSGAARILHPASCIIFAVSDTGDGIAPEDLPRIFDRFYRADRARSRSGGGAGLGLAIARRLVEAHGGSIDAASSTGQGTVVSFRLPITPEGSALHS